MTCEALTRSLGTQVDVMLGMDVLGGLHLRTNPNQGLVQFSLRPFRSSGARLPLRSGSVPPAVWADVNGEVMNLRLLTALKYNYLPAQCVDGFSADGSASDRLLLGLEITTPLYKLPISLGQDSLQLYFGIAPEPLPLQAGEGSLGADLLQTVPLTLAFPDGEMILYI